ncbi:NAD(P)/FAD-dependent oxidoreductase, partial [Patescibacteria group bacterium]
TQFGLNLESNGVDIGVRIETIAEAFEKFTDVVQSPKLVVQSDNNEVRTFCVCPHGFVKIQTSYGNLTVNGESFSKESLTKSSNTNFAILVHVDFTHPFDDPIGYGNEIARLTNMLGGRKVIVQTLYDLLRGQRSTEKRLERNSIVQPTLTDVVPADLARAYPHAVMSGVLKMLELLMKITPMNEHNVLLYGPEVKQYAQRVEIDRHGQTKMSGLYIVGDGSGWTRGIMQSSMMGIMSARNIIGGK